jgi:hypothetical protein
VDRRQGFPVVPKVRRFGRSKDDARDHPPKCATHFPQLQFVQPNSFRKGDVPE